ncbi:hypothetical protein NDU88_002644 [Pleurodeles waltl]|uniref:Uncharacterized protein n=1 Tax=Pleurodeles waltl TaxID=8319 RepID=A0AAV7TMI7_PLEWA|nr:hypothetical protein NDU88_002644 [Pleurodeles waltl]
MGCYTGLDEETLDYDEEREEKEGEIVDEVVSTEVGVNTGQKSRSWSNEKRSIGVLQKAISKMVQRDQTSGREVQKSASRHIPRGEKKNISGESGVGEKHTVIRLVSVAVGNSPGTSSSKGLGMLGGKDISIQANVEGKKDVMETNKNLDITKVGSAIGMLASETIEALALKNQVVL